MITYEYRPGQSSFVQHLCYAIKHLAKMEREETQLGALMEFALATSSIDELRCPSIYRLDREDDETIKRAFELGEKLWVYAVKRIDARVTAFNKPVRRARRRAA